ncbi:hypothetical protein [Pseudomonas panipatensis]|uniref:hypothetical protein n=1 Tax=Pseudomonas panipatensis TaxID=428992 RepID=UPI0035B2AE2B
MDIESFSIACQEQRKDYDYEFYDGFLLALGEPGLDWKVLKRFFLYDFDQELAAEESSFAYCPLCLYCDVCLIKFPYWRKAWRHFGYAYCVRHRVLLRPFSSRNSVFKSWVAFSESCEAVGRQLESAPLGAPRAAVSIRDRLAFRTQNWLQGKQRTRGAEAICRVVRLLMSSFLCVRTDSRAGGYARFLFSPNSQQSIVHRRIEFEACLRMGVSTATPVERASALLLVGLIFGLFNQSEIQAIKTYAGRRGYLFPLSAKEIGRFMPIFISRNEKDQFVNELQSMSHSLSEPLKVAVSDLVFSLK